MENTHPILGLLREEFTRWEGLIEGMSVEQIISRQLPDHQSIHLIIAHLMAWQQVSIARLEAAQQQREPVMPAWLSHSDPDSEPQTDEYNARIAALHQNQPWPQVYQAWRRGFLHFLALAEAIPEAELLDTSKYPWLKGYALVDVLKGSYEHHHVDHFEPLISWLREQQPSS